MKLNNLTASIKLYTMFEIIKEKYEIEQIDFSCCGILFCKVMEKELRKVLLPALKLYFPDYVFRNQKLRQLPEEKAMIGLFTEILKQPEIQNRLAGLAVYFNKQKCDMAWWSAYYSDLKDFKNLRNLCCHPEFFSWINMKALIYVLFERQEFLKTLVGKDLIKQFA